MIRRIFFVFLLTMLTGCIIAPKSTYEGERLPADQEAVLSADGEYSGILVIKPQIFINAVDGKSLVDVVAGLAGTVIPYPRVVFLKPGRHTIDIGYRIVGATSGSKVWFDAEPGKKYTANGEGRGKKVFFFITDDVGNKVGGAGEAPPL